MSTAPLEIFYAYAHEDEKLRDKLDTHLALLRKRGIIHSWHDREISAGSLWAREIDAHVQAARIILLLVSSAFMDSDYCYGREMQEALRRQERGGGARSARSFAHAWHAERSRGCRG
jgi:hypothetical protein